MFKLKLPLSLKKASAETISLTSEELYIQNHLEVSGIKYKSQVKLNNLRSDEKSYRIVDFYLPTFKVYVEYYGMYNSTKKTREDYDLKTKVYINNGLPTIFLYPHELGFLDYAFHSKMLKLLRVKKFKNNLITFRYKLSRFLSYGKPHRIFNCIFFAILSLFFFVAETGLTEKANIFFSLIFVTAFSHNLVQLTYDFIGYFFRDY